MHRQRKKDLNLKINRSLDKRSSRGMIYENEELRLRTISINEEVDRSQNDVKKLKKENEHLKREIWSLRDEYEKLEDMLKKVCVQANYDHSEFQPMSGYRPNRRISIGGDTLLTSAYDSEEDDGGSNILMIDEDGASIGAGSQEVILPLALPEEDSEFESTNTASATMYQNRVAMWSHHQHHSPELEVVREESENNSNSIHNASFCTSPSPLMPVSAEFEEEENELENIENDNQRRLVVSPACAPLIEITPASSPVSHNTPEESGTRSGSVYNNEIQDIGCVTVVPKLFQVTSELRISSSQEKEETKTVVNTDTTENDKTIPSTAATNTIERSTTGAAALPPPSPGTKVKSILTKGRQRKSGISGIRQNIVSNQHSTSDTTNMAVNTSALGENQQVQTMCRKLCPKRNSLVFLHGKPTRGGGSGRGSPILGLADCCPDFYSCYQSEPSLNSVGIAQDEYFCASPVVVSTAFNGFDQAVCLCQLSTLPQRTQKGQPNWNSIDNNVAVGILPEENEVTAQDVIDELEKQFDSTLETIAGVRMMPRRVFICLRTGDAVKKILELESFTIKEKSIKLFDASKRFSTIVLSGIPQDMSDFTVISTLNQFGQVVAPLEWRIYKGVDISERICHMHLVKNLQPVLSIAGYEVRAKIISQCQELSHSTENVKQELPSTSGTSITNTPALRSKSDVVPPKNISRTLRTPKPVQNSRNPQATPDSIQNQKQSQGQVEEQQGQLTSQEDLESEKNHRLSLPLPTSATKSHLPILQSISTPTHLQSQYQTLKGHKEIVRSSSSAPRLETVTDPAAEASHSSLNASILAKRKMSVIGATAASAEDHSSRTSLGVNNNLPPNPKKPLSRLMKSSPGSFIPLSLSGIRRASTVSQQNIGSGETGTGSSPTVESANNNNLNVFPGGVNSGRSRVFLHNQSQMSHQSSIPLMRGGTRLEKTYEKEPLPWCGCWGNGCI